MKKEVSDLEEKINKRVLARDRGHPSKKQDSRTKGTGYWGVQMFRGYCA